jgi:hypothetical protein
MNARFRPSSADQVESGAGLFDATASPGSAASSSGQACCCVARAVVLVVIPPSAGRPGETELLLCGHHYCVSRVALAAAHAIVSELPGSADDPDAWFNGDSGYLAKAPVPAS